MEILKKVDVIGQSPGKKNRKTRCFPCKNLGKPVVFRVKNPGKPPVFLVI